MMSDAQESTEARAAARAAVDSYLLPWASFAELFAEVSPHDAHSYLIALDEDAGTRQEWSRAAWRGLVERAARALEANGVRTGDSVATLCANSAEGLAFAFATWLLGACLVPLDPSEDDKRHAEILNECAARIVCVASDGELAARARRHEHVTTLVFPVTEDNAGGLEWTPPSTSLDSPALRIHTSGTTGSPKAVVLTMRGILINCAAMKDAFGWGETTRVLTVLPIQHVNGLLINCFLAWYSGASTVLWDRFRSSGFWRVVADTGATTSSLAPTILEFLLAAEAGPVPQHRLVEVISGSAPLRVETAAKFEQRFGVPVRQLYGLSETSAVLTVTPPPAGDGGAQMAGSVGPAVAHAEVRVVDASGQPRDEGETGELVARGGMIMAGYANDPAANARAFAGGWFHSGDSGCWRRGPDGRPWFFVVGRMRDSIVRGGLTIAPRSVEEVAERHGRVIRAAAFPIPNKWYGEEVGLCVVADGPLSETEVLDWCAERLARSTRPKAVFLVDEFPATRTGKLRRAALAELFPDRIATLWNDSFPESRTPASAHRPTLPPTETGA